jgi:hypothetical protein
MGRIQKGQVQMAKLKAVWDVFGPSAGCYEVARELPSLAKLDAVANRLQARPGGTHRS